MAKKELNRIQEIALEIKDFLKKKSNPEKVAALQLELEKLLLNKRLPPTIYKEASYTKTLKRIKEKNKVK